jgi:hypothetical protein
MTLPFIGRQSEPTPDVALAIMKSIWIFTGQEVRYLDMSFSNTVYFLACKQADFFKNENEA